MNRIEPRQWSLIWKTIRDHERVYLSVAQRATEPDQHRVIKEFLSRWDPIYVEAMEINSLGGRVPVERIRKLVFDLFVARERAMRIGLGLDRDRGVFYPKIDERTMRAIGAYRRSPPLTIAGEPVMARPVPEAPEAFRAACCARLSNDHVLALTCEAGGKRYATAIDLKPIAAQIKTAIRDYHLRLHGEGIAGDQIAGLGDWYRDSIRVAARIAHAKAAKRLWAQVQKHHGVIEGGLAALGPFGTVAAIGMRTGLTVQRMLGKAQAGDPAAIGDVKAIVALSKQGDPSAQQVTEIMRAMNEMAKRKDEKVVDQVGGWWWNRPYRVAAASPDLVLRGLYNLGMAS